MNNTPLKYSLLLLLPVLLLLSCEQEDIPPVVDTSGGIFFRTDLPVAESRSNATTVVGSLDAGFHVSAFCPENEVAGALEPYFAEQVATPLEGAPCHFGMLNQSSELLVWPTIRHGKQGKLKFFAFYPSREVMMQSAGVESGYFGLTNKTTKSGAAVAYDYRLEGFKVNKDISRHVDFVTATAEGSRTANSESGVRLDFEHQLSRVAFTAWGKTDNDIEIAGVRIGRAITESDFNFAAKPTNFAQGDATLSGNWIAPQKRDCVEYIFREGDTVIKIGQGNHASAATAASIMGNGGWAMVIPADNPVWKHTTDASNKNQGLYFSVLLRVKENDESKTLVYPYIAGVDMSSSDNADKMTVIYFSIERATGKIIRRLYKNEGSYFKDPEFTEVYAVPETEEIRNYGWAAIPLSTTLRWKPGYQYTYILDYSDGVGVHDPDDPLPGYPIISRILVGVTENGKTWHMVNDFTEDGKVDVTDQIVIK